MRRTTLCVITGISGKTLLNSDVPISGSSRIPKLDRRCRAIYRSRWLLSIPLAATAMRRAEPNFTARFRIRVIHPASLRSRCSLRIPYGSRRTTALYKEESSLGCGEEMSADVQEVRGQTERRASRVDLCGALEVRAKVRLLV